MKADNINTGDSFFNWCVVMGRTVPTPEIIAALNRSMDEGSQSIKNYLTTDASIWQNYCSFLAGRGRRV